jgi:hypothetical protein
MEKKTVIKWGILGAVALFILIIAMNIISWSNREIQYRNAFIQKYSERTAFYDKLWKTLSQKSQIALRNDSSFRQNVNIIMSGRKDAQGIFMKWITESNPNANFNEVSALYKDLSRSVEAQREGFFVQEKYLQDIVQSHSNHIQELPGSFYNFFFGRKKLEYSPITSTITENAIKSGKDDNVKLF